MPHASGRLKLCIQSGLSPVSYLAVPWPWPWPVKVSLTEGSTSSLQTDALLAVWDFNASLAGHASPNCPTAYTTFTPLSNVTCRTPSQQPGCFPLLRPGNMPADYSHYSGWTDDGRALHSLGTALALQPGALSFPAPCLLTCNGLPQGNNTAAYPPGPPQGNNTAPYSPGTGTASPFYSNSTMPPPPQLCFQCQLDEMMTPRVSELDFSRLVMLGVVPPSNLRLVPEMAGLQGLRTLRASGLPVQGTRSHRTCCLLCCG